MSCALRGFKLPPLCTKDNMWEWEALRALRDYSVSHVNLHWNHPTRVSKASRELTMLKACILVNRALVSNFTANFLFLGLRPVTRVL